MPSCGTPGCDGQLPGGRWCNMWSCDNIVHHACCTEWYNKQGLPDSDSNQAYCWTCIKKNYPERCGGGDGDDGGDGDGGDGIGVGGGIGGGGGGGDVAGGGGGGAAAAARRANRGNTSSCYSGAEFEAGRLDSWAFLDQQA